MHPELVHTHALEKRLGGRLGGSLHQWHRTLHSQEKVLFPVVCTHRGKATLRIPKEAGEAKGRWQGEVAVSWEDPLRWHSSLEPACRFFVNMNGFLRKDASGAPVFTVGYEVRAASRDNI